VDAVQAQETKLRLGPAIGTRSTRIEIVQQGNPAFGVVTPPENRGYTFGLVAGLEAPITRNISLRAELEGGYGWATAADRIEAPLLFNGQQVQGTLLRSYLASQLVWDLALGAKMNLIDNLSLDARLGLQMCTGMSTTGTESVESPDGAIFESDGTMNRAIRFLRYSDDYQRIASTVSGGLEYESKLTYKTSLITAARARYTLASVANTYEWRPWDVSLSVQFAWTVSDKPEIINEDGLAVPAEKAVIYKRNLKTDTVTIVAAGYSVRRDTLWSIQENETIDTLFGFHADTVRSFIVQRVERILPAPPPFLSAILTADIVNAGSDSSVALSVEIDVIADTTTTSTVSINYSNINVVSKVSLGRTNRKEFLLMDLIPGLSKQTYIKLEVFGETTDATGKTVQFPSQEIVLKRKTVTESLK